MERLENKKGQENGKVGEWKVCRRKEFKGWIQDKVCIGTKDEIGGSRVIFRPSGLEDAISCLLATKLPSAQEY